MIDEYEFYNLCKNGNLNEINKYIKNDNWNLGLRMACENGHINIVKLMIKNGANELDWNESEIMFWQNSQLNIEPSDYFPIQIYCDSFYNKDFDMDIVFISGTRNKTIKGMDICGELIFQTQEIIFEGDGE